MINDRARLVRFIRQGMRVFARAADYNCGGCLGHCWPVCKYHRWIMAAEKIIRAERERKP